MGYGRELPWLLIVALCAGVPFFVGALAFGSGHLSVIPVAAGLIGGATGLFVLFTLMARHTRMMQRDMRKLAGEIGSILRETREERRIAADLSAQVSVLRSDAESLATTFAADVSSLRSGHASLAKDLRNVIERQYVYQSQVPMQQSGRRPIVVHPSQWTPVEQQPAPQMDEPAPPENLPSVQFDEARYADSLVVSLEPVIDLFSGKTAHYRLHHMLETNGAPMPEAKPALDVLVFKEALLVLRRLRKRDPRLCLFVPVSSAALGSADALARIVELQRSEPGVSDGLVADIPHAVLASLPPSSIEGLAYLARAGMELSLSGAAVAGLDLAALDKLNVRYIAISSGSVGSEPRQSLGIANFVQAARALHVQVIVTGVAQAQQATQLMRVARFASGPAFAEPRRVRRDVAQGAPVSDDVSAAAE